MWRGPALKGRSPGSSFQVFQQWTEATFSCLGIRLAGAGGGGGRWQSTASSRKKSILPRDLASSVSARGIQRPRDPRKGGRTWGEEGGVQRPQPSPDLRAQVITAFGGCPGGEQGGHPHLPGPSCLPEPTGNRGLQASLPQRHPWPRRRLHFLGFSADLVIVVNADGDKNEGAGQEQQDPQGHEARLG